MEKKSSKSMLLNVFIVFLTVLLFGCSETKSVLQDDPFFKLYEAKITETETKLQPVDRFPAITLSAYQMPLSLFCRIMADKYKIGIVFSESLQEKMITAEFHEADLQSVFNVISRQISVDVVRVGSTYYIGELRPEDRGVLIRRVLGLTGEDLKTSVGSMLSKQGTVSILMGSVLVINDHESVLRRVSESLDYISAVDISTWIVQLYFVSLRRDLLLQAGLNIKSAGTLSYDISNNRIDFKDFRIDGLFDMAGQGTLADVYAAPMFLVRDGSSARWQDGERTPIPKKSVSDYGTVQTTGYEYVDTGFIVDASLSESNKGALLTLDITMSEIKNYVDSAPVTAQSNVKMTADLVADRLYLVGELARYKQIFSAQQILMLGRDSGKTSMQVWARVYKITGDTLRSIPKR